VIFLDIASRRLNSEDDEIGTAKKVDLAFEGIELLLQKKGGTRVILDGSIRGRAQPGRMLAILGPSGAGKSTVLHALAGRIKYSSNLKLFGARYLNGQRLTADSMVPTAFIEQDVAFFPHMTVRETLSFRVELKIGSLVSKKARDDMVDELLEEVGLTQAANTIVGDQKVRGISGGERKRLSIAVEMIGKLNIFFRNCSSILLSLIIHFCAPQDLRQLFVWMNQPRDWIRLQPMPWSKLCVTWPIVERQLSQSSISPINTSSQNLTTCC
jgi:ABC-type glutathione transport system ATPase component